MSSDNHDILIIGGGPAGCAAAAMLARAGRRVLLVEKERFPRDKLCGEFLSGEALPLFERLGCGAAIEAANPARLMRWRFTAPSGREIEGRLPLPAAGLSRRALDDILFRHAAACGAEARDGVEARRLEIAPDGCISAVLKHGPEEIAVTAPLAIAAWGRHAGLARGDGRPPGPRRVRPAPYIGVKLHHVLADGRAGAAAGEALDGFVEIHAFRGGYCGMSFVEGGRVNVCMLLERRFIERLGAKPSEWGRLAEALAASNRALAARLEGLMPAGSERPLIVAQPAFGRRELVGGSVLHLGDAAGMIPPLCGDGQAMALGGAVALSGLIAALPSTITPQHNAELGRRWASFWRREFGTRIAVGRVLQAALSRPILAEAGVRALGVMPWAASGLARATRGSAT